MMSFQKFRIYADKFMLVMIYLFSFMALIPFLILIWSLFKNGLRNINLNFFTQTFPSPTDAMLANLGGETIPGGILNGICGSLYIILIALVLAVPLGILTGVYLYDNQKKKFAVFIQYINSILYGMPSILVGITVYLFVVKSLHSFSALAGGIALAIILLPMFVRSIRETLKTLPAHLKESGLALGGSYTRVLLKIVLPAAKDGLLMSLLISLSRALGKTTPLIITTLGCSMVNWDINSPTSSLSLLIWDFFNNPDMVDMVWSTSLFLFIVIICLNLIAKRISRRWKHILLYE
jgi:phosphate transport system permease protein